MRTILDRALIAFRIVLDIIWIGVMAIVGICIAAIASGLAARLFRWAFNLVS